MGKFWNIVFGFWKPHIGKLNVDFLAQFWIKRDGLWLEAIVIIAANMNLSQQNNVTFFFFFLPSISKELDLGNYKLYVLY